MAVARTRCVALIGVTGHMVEVETDVANGIVATNLIGLLDTTLTEARDRVRSAVVNSGFSWPDARITVSLFPADLPKRGSGYDLAIAVSILAAARMLPADHIVKPVFLGELGLEGRIRPVRGVLPAVIAAAEAGAGIVVVPGENAPEAALVPGLTVVAASTLAELVGWIQDDDLLGNAYTLDPTEPPPDDEFPENGVRRRRPDLSDVAGQPVGRRALEVCAAGGHNLWMLGPPGTGKTMLAERMPTLLPRLDRAASLEVSAVHSVAGTLPPTWPLLVEPPFRSPHHTSTTAAMVGGGSGQLKPGAASLAHRGVLFLDEAPEFAMNVLDCLRQPLESGYVMVSRAAGTVTFPARFMLVLAANPCPCAGSGTAESPCICTPNTRRRYLARLSGPLLDRVDVKVTLFPASRHELLSDRRFLESSAVVAERVLQARDRAARRYAGTPWRTNAEVPGTELCSTFRIPSDAFHSLEGSLDDGSLSARGVDRVLRVAWTLADLAAKPKPTSAEVHAALMMWKGVPS
ncbi:YifB family Mg chelatase-like AAA ATPase [Rhizohabitans arisaemae]|uniref:YifB family Mg chelatase-like AAA ATPase n=1 Tax=Rhizohabitans arisaemae TaxID=2720610 RepID=UPI0024B15DD8|nr:YifB family Mg chelatase-like AAA ATPase [Rhizohabitans arisaemae]